VGTYFFQFVFSLSKRLKGKNDMIVMGELCLFYAVLEKQTKVQNLTYVVV